MECGEGNGKFNFSSWIIKNELINIKECLIEYDMNTLNNLDMNSNNFGKLISDKRILTKPHLIQRLVSSILLLKKEKEKETPKGIEKRKELESKSISKLVFMTEKENNVFIKIQEYINDLENYGNELNICSKKYKNKKKENNIKINN